MEKGGCGGEIPSIKSLFNLAAKSTTRSNGLKVKLDTLKENKGTNLFFLNSEKISSLEQPTKRNGGFFLSSTS